MNRTTSPRIHPTAQIGQNVSLGCDVVVGAHAIIYDNVMIGDYSVVGPRVTIGEPDARFYHSDQYEFPSTRIGAHAVIRSGTVIYSGCQVGDGFQTGHYAVIREKTTAGKHCSFGTFAQSDGDCALGDYVRIHYAAHVCRTARIGSFVWIYPYSVLTNDIHPPCSLCVEGPTVEDYAVITTACIILPRVKIGQHALVAANSVVTRDVPAEAIAAGIPAKVVGSVRSIDCDADAGVKTPYPWPTHFERGYPWEDVAWDEWVGPDSVRE